MTTTGDRLWKAVRARKIRGPAALARLAKLNPVTVASYMRDERTPSLEACFELGRALNVDPHWLRRGDGADPVGDVTLPEAATASPGRIVAMLEKSDEGRNISIHAPGLTISVTYTDYTPETIMRALDALTSVLDGSARGAA